VTEISSGSVTVGSSVIKGSTVGLVVDLTAFAVDSVASAMWGGLHALVTPSAIEMLSFFSGSSGLLVSSVDLETRPAVV